jgi:hypothetical protein
MYLAFLAFGCGTEHRSGILNAELSKAVASYDATMAARRTELRFQSGQSVSNCSEYVKLRSYNRSPKTSTMDAIPSTADDYAAMSDTPDWFYKIEAVANLDLDANGTCDWLLWLIDEAKTGNYRGYEALVIYSPPATGFLTAKQIA